MRSSSCKEFSIYDFSEEDEVVESASKALMKKFMTPRSPIFQKSPLTKYSFLQCFAGGSNVQVETENVLCVDIDDKGNYKNIGSYPVGTPARVSPVQEESSWLDDPMVSTSTNNDEHNHIGQDEFEPGSLIPQWEKLVDVISDDDDESLEVDSRSTSGSYLAEDEGAKGPLTSHHCSSEHREMAKKVNTEIVVFPDYVSYEDRLFTRSQLTFFTDRIKLKNLNECGSNKSSSFEWATDDLLHIECQQSESVATSLFKLYLRRTDGVEVHKRGTSGIVTLEFVSEPWQEKEQMITSLTAGCKARRNFMLGSGIAREEDDFIGQNSMFYLKRYFNNFDEPFEDVVYPKGDPDAISLTKRDVELLQPGTFINDTIVDFYIKYLQNKIQPAEKNRFHFFNSFFFRKLVDLDKDPKRSFEGMAAFQRVRKWTRKVNMFEKDYIFIPVNYNLHWSLIVICHPGEVAYFEDEETQRASKVPCILHMDSIKGSHRGLKNLVQSYLWEEWKERHEESSEIVLEKFLNLRFVPLELPQQENSSDCGLFLLHYVELFLEEAPVNFSPFKITKFSNFLSRDWFLPIEASHKRSTIQRLIYELLNDHSMKITPATYSSQFHTSRSPENNADKEYAIDFVSGNPFKKGCSGDSVCSTAHRGIDIEFLLSSPGGNQNDKGTGVALQEVVGQGAAASRSRKRDLPFDQIVPLQSLDCTMLPIEEGAETTEQLRYSPLNLDEASYRLPDGIKAVECITSYSCKDVEMSLSHDFSVKLQHNNGDSLSESSSCRSPKFPKVRTNEHSTPCTIRYLTSPTEPEGTGKVRSITPTVCVGDSPEIPIPEPSSKLEDCIVEDSLEAMVGLADRNETGNSLSSHPENHPSSSCQGIGSSADGGDNMKWIGNSLECRSRYHVRKRINSTPPDGERRHTRSCTRI